MWCGEGDFAPTRSTVIYGVSVISLFQNYGKIPTSEGESGIPVFCWSTLPYFSKLNKMKYYL